MADNRRRYNRAVGIAEFIAEGHTIGQTIEEFGVAKDTIRRDLVFLAQYGYGKENEKNMKLYVKAKKQLNSNTKNCKANKKEASC